MGFDRLSFMKERLELYYEAEKKILNSQSYTLGSKQLTRADLGEVQNKIKELETDIEKMERRGTTKRRSVRAVPID